MFVFILLKHFSGISSRDLAVADLPFQAGMGSSGRSGMGRGGCVALRQGILSGNFSKIPAADGRFAHFEVYFIVVIASMFNMDAVTVIESVTGPVSSFYLTFLVY